MNSHRTVCRVAAYQVFSILPHVVRARHVDETCRLCGDEFLGAPVSTVLCNAKQSFNDGLLSSFSLHLHVDTASAHQDDECANGATNGC